MKIVKTILLVIVGIIALVLIVAMFTKKEYAIEREIVINQPKQVVFDYIKLLKNQDNYSKWAKMDPNSKKVYKGTDGTVGFVSAWESLDKNVGQGEQEIVKIDEGNRIDLGLHFIKPFDAKASAYMVTETVTENQTKVKWGFASKMPYPMNIMLLFMDMEKMLGDDLNIGLTSLKGILEK